MGDSKVRILATILLPKIIKMCREQRKKKIFMCDWGDFFFVKFETHLPCPCCTHHLQTVFCTYLIWNNSFGMLIFFFGSFYTFLNPYDSMMMMVGRLVEFLLIKIPISFFFILNHKNLLVKFYQYSTKGINKLLFFFEK